MPKLLLHRGHMYLGNAKSGTTSVKKHFDAIKDDSSMEIPNSDNFTKQYLQTIQHACDPLEKFVLFFHVREPWDRFLSAIATDIKRSADPAAAIERCEEIRDKYQYINHNDPGSVESTGLVLNFTPVLETVYKVILLTLPPMKERILRIDAWNYGSLKDSMQQNWNCDFVARENVTPNNIKRTVYNFFEQETEFKKKWMRKNKKDYLLYALVENKHMHSLSCKEYINQFYEKI